MNILEIRGLEKSFKNHKVLKGINLAVPEHTVYGFIGPNGAGKTTTMKIVLGLLKGDAGQVRVCNKNVVYGNTRTNEYVGYLPDVPEFYGYMTPEEYLRFCGKITGMPDKDITCRSHELLELTGLKESRRKRIGGFSRGMKQRLGIAQALLNQPKLLICDEPTSALDPLGRIEILKILERVKEKTTVIFSTHILSDVERICSQVAILKEGKIVKEGSIDSLKSQQPADSMSIEFLKGQDAVKMLERMKFKNSRRDEETKVTVYSEDIYKTQHEIMEYLASRQTAVEKMEINEPTLENLFMEALK